MPVGARFLAQPRHAVAGPLGFQQRHEPCPQPDTTQEVEADGEAPLLGLREQPFPQPSAGV